MWKQHIANNFYCNTFVYVYKVCKSFSNYALIFKLYFEYFIVLWPED